MYNELVKTLRNLEWIGNGAKYTVNQAADAIEALTAENTALRNELCLRCGAHLVAHIGGCKGCRWKGEK